jgi:mannosyltransferase
LARFRLAASAGELRTGRPRTLLAVVRHHPGGGAGVEPAAPRAARYTSLITRARDLGLSVSRGLLIQLTGLSLAAFALRVWWLARQSFWLDEGFSAALSAGPLWYILQQSFTKEPNPPFYFLLLHLWRSPAGSGEYAIRFLSVLPAVAAIPLLYAAGRRLGGRWAGLAAMTLGALNPYLVWLAQEARMYSWALLWTVLGAYALLRALASGRRSHWALFAAANFLAVYTHLYAVFVVAAEALFLVLHPRRRKLAAGLVAVAAPIVLFLPWFISITTYAGESSTWRGFIGVWDMLRVLGVNFASQGHLPPALDGPFALLLALAGGAGLWALRRRGWLPLLWLLLPIAGVYALSFKEPLFSARYFIVVLPALLLLAGAGLARLGAATGLAGLALLSAGSVWAAERGQTVPSYAKEDYRLAASYVGARSTPSDAVVLVANYILYPFSYYFRGAGQVLPLDVQPDSDLDALLAPLAQHDHIWLVEAHDVFVDPQDRVGKWLRERYPVEDEKYIIAIHFTEFDLHPTVAALPASATPVNAAFQDGPRLAGYSVSGGSLAKVTLFWRGAAPKDYHLSLKLWASNARLAGQQDGEPLNAGLPFTKFPAQGLVRDEHFISAPPGTYDVRLSVYLPGAPDLATGTGETQLSLGRVSVQ